MRQKEEEDEAIMMLPFIAEAKERSDRERGRRGQVACGCGRREQRAWVGDAVRAVQR